MTSTLRPTLGPLGGTVVVAGSTGTSRPEVLNRAGTIARRTVQLPDDFENMGAMIARHLVWRVQERAGDGTATAAVFADRLLAELSRAVAAGANPQQVRDHLDSLLPVVVAHLRELARPIDGRDDLLRVISGTLPEPDVAEIVAEVLDALGPDATVRVLDGHGTETTCTYREGASWQSGFASRFFLAGDETVARLVDARVLITDQSIDAATDLLPAIEICVAAGVKSLLVIAPGINDSALGLLLVNRERGVLPGALAVKAPGHGINQTQILEDMATITGGTMLSGATNRGLAKVELHDLGTARQVWADATAFGILGGGGRSAARRARLRDAFAHLDRLTGDDGAEAEKERQRARIGNLSGAVAEIRVGGGGAMPSAKAELKQRVESALSSGRAAMRDGCVPGAGTALLAVGRHVAGDADEPSLVATALRRALAEPMTVIARNAGLDPAPLVAEAERRGPDWAYDVAMNTWVDPWSQNGLLDPVATLIAALEVSCSAVGSAITIETLVHHREPPISRYP